MISRFGAFSVADLGEVPPTSRRIPGHLADRLFDIGFFGDEISTACSIATTFGQRRGSTGASAEGDEVLPHALADQDNLGRCLLAIAPPSGSASPMRAGRGNRSRTTRGRQSRAPTRPCCGRGLHPPWLWDHSLCEFVHDQGGSLGSEERHQNQQGHLQHTLIIVSRWYFARSHFAEQRVHAFPLPPLDWKIL